MSPLVNPAALFRLRLSCPPRQRLWPPAGRGLDDACRLPSFAAVAGVPDVLTLWLAWNDDGLAVRAVARGVGSSRWCQPTRPEDSDGLHLWIATRPTGGGRTADKPVVLAAAIPRTSEVPAELPADSIAIASKLGADGWEIDAAIGAAALPGWDPREVPRLGFFAAIVDRRLGRVPAFAPPEYPWDGDPTTWIELDLVR